MARVRALISDFASLLALVGALNTCTCTTVIGHHKEHDDNWNTRPVKVGGCSFEVFDATFFNNTQVIEIVKGSKELNIPIIRGNRKLVASANGGLNDPSVLVFNPHWQTSDANNPKDQYFPKRFKYPSLSAPITRPLNDEDVAFMTILELGQLIKSKQITSLELTEIFLARLKRYNGVLEAVVTFTEELPFCRLWHWQWLINLSPITTSNGRQLTGSNWWESSDSLICSGMKFAFFFSILLSSLSSIDKCDCMV